MKGDLYKERGKSEALGTLGRAGVVRVTGGVTLVVVVTVVVVVLVALMVE